MTKKVKDEPQGRRKVRKKKRAVKKEASSRKKPVGKKERLPARTVIRRPKPPEPEFLQAGAKERREGFKLMMSGWNEFVKVPLSYVKEKDLKRLLDEELSKQKRWGIVNRLHSAYYAKLVKRERGELRKACGL